MENEKSTKEKKGWGCLAFLAMALMSTVLAVVITFTLMEGGYRVPCADSPVKEHTSPVVTNSSMPQILFLPGVTTNVVTFLDEKGTTLLNMHSDEVLTDGMRLANPEERMTEKDAKMSLFAINHINWVVTKIKTYNDPAILEEEYKGLTVDALNLRVIKDPELIDLICRILDVIVEMRIEEKERVFLKDELDQGASEALADAVSGIRITGINPIAMVANAVTSVASAANNYRKAKRALQKKFERQNWALDKNRLYYLNDLNKELLRDFWAIVQRYPNLPDEYRVSEKNIQLLVDHLKDEDAKKRFEFLFAVEEQFTAFQPYWYHRAVAAYEVANNSGLDDETRDNARKDARASLKTYMNIQIDCGNILRKDPIAAKAALLRAAMLSEDGSTGLKAYQDAIEVVVRNSSVDDWQAAYFCALISVLKLNDISQAEKILAPVISELDWQRRRRLVDWKEAVDTKFACKSNETVPDLLTVGDALYECRTLIANTATLSDDMYIKQLKKICEDQNASVREKMFCYGSMNYKQALEQLRSDISRIRVSRNGKQYYVSLPFSWVIARDVTMKLCVKNIERDESIGKRSIEVREDDNQYVRICYGPVASDQEAVKLRVRFDRNGGRGVNGKAVPTSFMVEVDFPPGGDIPRFATFGQWIQSEDATEPSHWRMRKATPDDKDGKPCPDVETIIF